MLSVITSPLFIISCFIAFLVLGLLLWSNYQANKALRNMHATLDYLEAETEKVRAARDVARMLEGINRKESENA